MTVVAVPGPSAITAALSIAGLPTERFSFEGFLPARLGERRARIAELAGESRTLVFFEAPHRIAESLEDLAAGFGTSRRAAVARELTKVFETVYRGTIGELGIRRAATRISRAAKSPWSSKGRLEPTRMRRRAHSSMRPCVALLRAGAEQGRGTGRPAHGSEAQRRLRTRPRALQRRNYQPRQQASGLTNNL